MSSIYTWVYWICIRDHAVLMIKKARGPYIGLYDLPGWGIEFWEHIEQALEREILEETWVGLISKAFVGNNEYLCEYINPMGQPKSSHHIGFYYSVELENEEVKTSPDGEDSLGALWIPIDELSIDSVSPIAYPMIQKVVSPL